jgi:hypothetical protein
MLFSIFSPITRPTLTSAWAVWQRHGTLLERAPTGGSTSARNSVLLFQRQAWARTSGGCIVGAPSARRSAMAFRARWLPAPLPRSGGGAGQPTPARLPAGVQWLEAGQEFPGLSLDLAEIWGI